MKLIEKHSRDDAIKTLKFLGAFYHKLKLFLSLRAVLKQLKPFVRLAVILENTFYLFDT